MFRLLGSLIGIVPSALKLGDKIADLKIQQSNNASAEERLRIQSQIDVLTLQQQIVVAEQSSGTTRWVRPAICFPFVVYLWKLVIFDYVLEMGTTQPLNDDLMWVMGAIITAYFLVRPFEKR